MKKYFKVIADGYRQGSYDDESSAMQAANRLSYLYKKVTVRPVHANGHPFRMADDIIVQQGVVSYRPMLRINGINVT